MLDPHWSSDSRSEDAHEMVSCDCLRGTRKVGCGGRLRDRSRRSKQARIAVGTRRWIAAGTRHWNAYRSVTHTLCTARATIYRLPTILDISVLVSATIRAIVGRAIAMVGNPNPARLDFFRLCVRGALSEFYVGHPHQFRRPGHRVGPPSVPPV